VRLAALVLLLLLGGFAIFVLTLPGPAEAGVRTDGAAVLTGAPGRIGRGVEVLKAGGTRRLLVSGVDPSVTPAQFRDANAVPAPLFRCCTDLGFHADSTRSNAGEVADWARRHGFRSVRVITSNYHMPRALAEIAATLPQGVRIVADAVPAPLTPRLAVTEYLKFLAARLMLLRP
jgi:uncharacterized SAM-binding protein YcdF (DUF218 family)